MNVTIDFIKYFTVGLLYCLPLLLCFATFVLSLGYWVGRVERWSFSDSIYWTVITATTVGYGDFRPTKHRARLLAIPLVLVGMMYTGIIVALTVMATSESIKKNIDFSNWSAQPSSMKQEQQ